MSVPKGVISWTMLVPAFREDAVEIGNSRCGVIHCNETEVERNQGRVQKSCDSVVGGLESRIVDGQKGRKRRNKCRRVEDVVDHRERCG